LRRTLETIVAESCRSAVELAIERDEKIALQWLKKQTELSF